MRWCSGRLLGFDGGGGGFCFPLGVFPFSFDIACLRLD
jgi:hypothetical protein